MLEKEINLFWKWAKLTPQQYEAGKKPDHIRQNPWHDSYPDWKNMEVAFDKEIVKYNSDLNEMSAQLILEALAIDSESELLLQKIIKNLDNMAQIHLSSEGSRFYMSGARWQIAEFLKEAKVPDKKELLSKMVLNDANKYVQRRALLSLQTVDPFLTEEYAFQKLNDEDEYIRLVSIRILKDLKSKKIDQAKGMLKGDISTLIQKELNQLNNP
ncbi:MAG: hypothetical protein M3512_10590 [Bacteroidota bacterium]|nr:hypothetical protein [Bacteroidota bacterium]